MRIGVVFTGGTIGSQIDRNGYIAPHTEASFLLLDMYRTVYKEKMDSEEITFVIKEPYRILSENLQGEQIVRLAEAIKKMQREEDLGGIIITHGTDTLQYTAAMLGYLFGDADIPIVLVSSNYILEDKRANGLANFRYAVEFICGGWGTGVFVSYQNTGEHPVIHRGTRLMAPLLLEDAVYSVKGQSFGWFQGDAFCKNTDYLVCEGLSVLPIGEPLCLTNQAEGIMWIHPAPGMVYPSLQEGVKVILHESYHSGTIADSEGLRGFAAEAARLGIPFYLTGLAGGEREYETVRMYEELRIIPLAETAVIAQYCKLWLGLSNGLDIRELMQVSVAEDICLAN